MSKSSPVVKPDDRSRGKRNLWPPWERCMQIFFLPRLSLDATWEKNEAWSDIGRLDYPLSSLSRVPLSLSSKKEPRRWRSSSWGTEQERRGEFIPHITFIRDPLGTLESKRSSRPLRPNSRWKKTFVHGFQQRRGGVDTGVSFSYGHPL